MSHEIIARYEAGATLLSYSTQGLTHEQGTARPGPGDWSITELVAHVLDTDLVFADRMKRVIAEEKPTLLAFDEQPWAVRLGYDAMPLEEAVGFFVANRRWMTRLLKRCSDADFARTGIHTEKGEQKLAEIVVYVSNHVDHHLRFLYGKRANLGVALYPRYTTD